MAHEVFDHESLQEHQTPLNAADRPDRREFLKKAGLAVAAGGLTLAAAACGEDGDTVTSTEAALEDAAQTVSDEGGPEIEWQMATSWPANLDTVYGGAEAFANSVAAMTGGRFLMTPSPGGELTPSLDVLQAVQDGTIPSGHTASHYSVGVNSATAFGTAIPFGLTSRQQNAWLYEGRGLRLMRDFYADRFNVINFPAGNTGVQMGGWFNREIGSLGDLQGLRMRIPGLGGQVMDRLGVAVQQLSGDQIFEALSTGNIDAAEWVGPYDDTELALHDAASFYYYPGWWEPGATLDVFLPLDAWNSLPEEYQAIVEGAAAQANLGMMAKYDALNPPALATILQSDIELRPFPDDVMDAAQTAAFEIYDQNATDNPDFAAIFGPWKEFRDGIQGWHGLAETEMLRFTAAN